MKKRKTQIAAMNLNTPTFHDEPFQPGMVNFIYGVNGSGKSTLANAIVAKKGIEWAKGCDPNVEIFIYNEEYRLENISKVDEMPAVFTLSKKNVENKKRIEEATLEIEEAQKKRMEALERAEEYDQMLAEAASDHERIIMGLASGLKEKFPKVFEETGDFVGLVDSAIPRKMNEDALKYMYEAGQNQVEYQPYLLLEPMLMEVDPLMGAAIVNLGDSRYAHYIRNLGAMDWVRHGHDAFGKKAGKMCPYCGQGLPDSFEEEYRNCFDEQYKKDLAQLDSFIEEYKGMLGRLGQALRSNVGNTYEMGPVASYREWAVSFSEAIQKSLAILEEKKKSPGEALELPDLHLIAASLDRMAGEMNADIEHLISYQKSHPRDMDMCRKGVVEGVAFLAVDEMKRHKERVESIMEKKKKFSQEASFARNREERLTREIEELSHSMSDTSEVVDLINAELKVRNFQGFYLRQKPGMAGYYELVRDEADGTVTAKGLSEGERHFFSFLFFYHQVMGSTRDDGKVVPKIVIIDDPVCSLDSRTFFAVASMVRRMVEICLNNADENLEEGGTFIKQLFCFTHNPVFLKDVGKPYMQDYENCSFFEVTKNSQNHSRISLCEDQVRDGVGVAMRNRMPVEDAYDASWAIVRDSDEIYPLLLAAQTILEQDFVVHGGMINGMLAEELLVNRAKDLIDAETGDMTIYNIVDALISTFGATRLMKYDSLHFDIKAVDPDQIREAFHLIYTMMRQEEHYKAMMGG